MCREQLVKLRPHVKKLLDEGAVVLGMSMDSWEEASRLAMDLNLAFPILSDRNMVIVREYGMDGKEMGMPEMGYAIIDKQGRIQTQKIDRRFGENADVILGALRKAKRQA
jgi:peroxiredoxin